MAWLKLAAGALLRVEMKFMGLGDGKRETRKDAEQARIVRDTIEVNGCFHPSLLPHPYSRTQAPGLLSGDTHA